MSRNRTPVRPVGVSWFVIGGLDVVGDGTRVRFRCYIYVVIKICRVLWCGAVRNAPDTLR